MNEKRFVVLGDLIADCYYHGDELLRIDGGGSRFNVIANLASEGYNCAAIGGCGNDYVGNIVTNSLSAIGVDISNIYHVGRNTRIFNLSIKEENLPSLSYTCSKKSPIDSSVTWYENSIEDFNNLKDFINDNDVIILDEVDNFSMEIIKKLKNDLIIDIGNINYLKNLSYNQIFELQNKFEIMQLNERVAVYLMNMFHFNNLLELYNLLSPKLLVITYGNKGAIFIHDNYIIEKSLTHVSKEFDPTGAGDAFLSVLVRYYYDQEKIVDDAFIDNVFDLATELTSKVVQNFGARGHLYHKLGTVEKVKKLKYKD